MVWSWELRRFAWANVSVPTNSSAFESPHSWLQIIKSQSISFNVFHFAFSVVPCVSSGFLLCVIFLFTRSRTEYHRGSQRLFLVVFCAFSVKLCVILFMIFIHIGSRNDHIIPGNLLCVKEIQKLCPLNSNYNLKFRFLRIFRRSFSLKDDQKPGNLHPCL